MAFCDASSCLSLRTHAAVAALSPLSIKREPPPSSYSFFFRKPTFSSCIRCHTDSSSSASASTCPQIGQKTFNQASPEIVRHWIEVDQPHASPERFTVVSYNILGNRNASKHTDLYPNVPSVFMNWDYRKRVICEELIGWNPDIICLQEVDRYFDFLRILEKAGYLGSYKQRTGDSADGCATFWKAEKFQLLEGDSIEFKQFGLRDNIAQLSVLKMRKAEFRRLLIGNIHVLYNPNKGDIKLGQIRFLTSRAKILSEKWGDVPVVLAGDFNSTPQSAIYKFVSSSELNITSYPKKELSGQKSCHPTQVFGLQEEKRSPFTIIDGLFNSDWTNEEIKIATGDAKDHLVVHPLNLNSSYSTVKGSTSTRGASGEPLATSYHSKFFGTVDYLWYSDGIVPTKVLDTLPIDILQKTGGLPCKKLGSDHLALVSEFAFTQCMKEANNSSTAKISSEGNPGTETDNIIR